jgi:hypothetical protein
MSDPSLTFQFEERKPVKLGFMMICAATIILAAIAAIVFVENPVIFALSLVIGAAPLCAGVGLLLNTNDKIIYDRKSRTITFLAGGLSTLKVVLCDLKTQKLPRLKIEIDVINSPRADGATLHTLVVNKCFIQGRLTKEEAEKLKLRLSAWMKEIQTNSTD